MGDIRDYEYYHADVVADLKRDLERANQANLELMRDIDRARQDLAEVTREKNEAVKGVVRDVMVLQQMKKERDEARTQVEEARRLLSEIWRWAQADTEATMRFRMIWGSKVGVLLRDEK